MKAWWDNFKSRLQAAGEWAQDPSRERYVYLGGYLVLLLAAISVGALSGMLLGFSIDLPQVEELQDVRPNVVSYVYADDGREVIGEYALEKRVLVTYDQIPERLRNAILAAEDANFFEHSGIDVRRFLITVVRNVLFGEWKGASTLTMQLCKLRFTSSEKRIERKIKDMIFALEAEKKFSKEEIFTLYFNQIYMGHGIYGVAAAAQFYFNKTLDELTVAESALLAGILQLPERYTPIRHPDRALQRRAYALRRMLAEGYIDERTYQEAIDEPLQAKGSSEREPAAYFVEWVRQHLERNYPTDRIWKGGLRVYTTLNSKMQAAALKALRKGLLEFDKKNHPWEGAGENILEQGKELDDFFHSDWRQILSEGQLIHGLVVAVEPAKATLKFGSYRAELTPEDIAWTKKKRLDEALKVGDLVICNLGKIDRAEKVAEATLERIPEVQGAFLALDNQTGAIKAMVGGFDFQYSQFNRATQALRQPGSIFKPFTYAVAVEEGRSPFEKLLDAPFYHVDALGRPYEPKNSDEEFKGLIPMGQAMAESRNVPTIRLAKALGVRKVIQMAKRFGIDHQYVPVLSMALGAGELTLEEITSAFSTFGNEGVRAEPYFVRRVEDYDGQTLEEHQTEFEQVITPTVCAKMLYLLRSVVQGGTAWRAQAVDYPIVGKTGTTDESTDVWFVGITPIFTAGVWVGYDEKKTLGEEMYGGNLALPIWIDFMKEIVEDLPESRFASIYEPSALDRVLNPADPEITQPKKDTIAVEDIPPPAPNPDPEEEPVIAPPPVKPPRR